jgi:hypothetical protein
MATTGYPPVRTMLWEAVEELGSPTSNVAVRDWIMGRYPGTNVGTISAQLMFCSVNQPSRIHYQENHRTGVCNDARYDFLYCPARGQLEWYRPEKHGVWFIERDGEDGYAICCDGGELIRPARRGGGKVAQATPKGRDAAAGAPKVIPITQEQIEAASRLHTRMPLGLRLTGPSSGWPGPSRSGNGRTASSRPRPSTTSTPPASTRSGGWQSTWGM